MGLASGSVGAIYRQFTLSMAVSILFSAFLALTLTPALCATILKPATEHAPRGFFGWFNRHFDALTARYTGWVGWVLRRGGRMLVIYVALLVVLAVGYARVPTSFVPEEDQGSFFFAMFELPAGATAERTRDIVAAYEAHTATRPDITESTVILGFGFSGSRSQRGTGLHQPQGLERAKGVGRRRDRLRHRRHGDHSRGGRQ